MPSLIIKAGGTYTMSGKYMKIKRVIIPTLTMVMLSSMLFGCATKQDTYNMLQESTEIELEYAVPDYDNAEDSKVELLPWLQLSSLETHPELRKAFEELLGVTVSEDGTKTGIIYTDETGNANQNNTLFNALGSTNLFIDTIRDTEKLEKIESIASDNYTDIEDNQSIAAVINAYFELLPDQEDGQFDGDATISRAQAMALLMRATTQVNEAQAPEEDADFTKAVGETQYTNFAAPMDEYAYVNTSTGLNEETFTSAMSRGEYIYLLANYYSQDYQTYMDKHGFKNNIYLEDVVISTVSDAGDISFSDAISDPGKGVPSDMYKAFEIATNMELISESDLEDWDAAITKGEAVRLFTTMSFMYYHVAGDGSLMDEIAENIIYPDVNPEDVDPKATNIDGDIAFALGKQEFNEVTEEYGGYEPWTGYAQSQGADGTIGWCWVYDTGKGAGSEESYAVYMKEGSPRYGEVFHVGDYLPDGSLFTGANHQEYRMAENRILLRMYENGELGGTIVTEDENGMLHIIVE